MKKKPKSFFEASFNLFIFLPYFFSVENILKTLFNPWKNIISSKQEAGFSFGEWFNRFSFNLISRTMGFIIRTTILTVYLFLQALFIIIFPFITLFFFILFPVLFLLDKLLPTEQESKEKTREAFISNHLLLPENKPAINEWFENYYQKVCAKNKWWSLPNLMSIPPIGRDWSLGYTPILDQYSKELTSHAYQKQSPIIIGRTKEIKEIERVLSKSDEANVIIVGEEGVGKHTIVESFAKKVYEGKTNKLLMYKRILKLDMERILTKYSEQEQREEYLQELLEEAAKAKNVIIFIDSFDKYVSVQNSRVDLSLAIEKYAKGRNLQIIGITTPSNYHKLIYSNEKISRLFTKIDVNEVSSEEAIRILLARNYLFEERYKIVIPYETITNLVNKSNFYITDIPFPEKSVQLLDEACVFIVQDLKKTILTPDIIDSILSEKTHIPTDITDSMREKLINLEDLLSQRVIQQKKAMEEIASALRKSLIIKEKRKKPLATLLFLGPTGVGKTETAKALAEIFFGSKDYLVRFDMSTYQSKNDIPLLIGSQETGNPGLLSKALREKPYGVLLLDEIEKAERSLLNIFLTVLDEGYFVDGFGKRIDCKSLIVIATSNAVSDYIYESTPNKEPSTQKVMSLLIKKGTFSPEFLNRFDGVLMYDHLSPEVALLIAKRMLQAISNDIYTLYKVKLNVSDNTLRTIVDKDYNASFGARNIERALRHDVEDKIAKLLLGKKVKEGDLIEV